MSSHAGCTHDHAAVPKKVDLRPALALTGAVFLLEFAGGFWSGSLALLSDSLHVLFDAVALGLAWAATVLATRPASDRHSPGGCTAQKFSRLSSTASPLFWSPPGSL